MPIAAVHELITRQTDKKTQSRGNRFQSQGTDVCRNFKNLVYFLYRLNLEWK